MDWGFAKRVDCGYSLLPDKPWKDVDFEMIEEKDGEATGLRGRVLRFVSQKHGHGHG